MYNIHGLEMSILGMVIEYLKLELINIYKKIQSYLII